MKRTSSLVLLTAFLLFGCARTKEVVILAPQDPLQSLQSLRTLQQYESYVLHWQQPFAIGSLTVTLQKIEDSRCPKDVMCIWAGVAAADIQLQDSIGASISKTLSIGSMVDIPIGSKMYRLTLREITPYPRISDLNPAEKEARISVTVL